MSVFILKLIAMSTMVVDHIAYWFINNNTIMRNVGRMAFVIYAFLMAESFYHLKDKPDRLKKHVMKLFLLALITEVPYDFFEYAKWIDFRSQNVIITLLCGFLALIVSHIISLLTFKSHSTSIINTTILKRVLSVLVVIPFAAVTNFLKSEYAVRGVLLVVMFYLYRCHCDNLNLWQRLLFLLLIDIIYCFMGLWTRADFGSWNEIVTVAKRLSKWTVGMVVAFIPLAFYNRKEGYKSRWFGILYSVFYPLQFVVLSVIRVMVRGF